MNLVLPVLTIVVDIVTRLSNLAINELNTLLTVVEAGFAPLSTVL